MRRITCKHCGEFSLTIADSDPFARVRAHHTLDRHEASCPSRVVLDPRLQAIRDRWTR